MKGKVVKILINVLNFKNKEGFKIDETDKNYNYVFVNSLVIKNPDKLCTWSTVTLKLIVQRSRTSSGIHHSNLSNVLEFVGLLVKAKS